MVGAPARMLDEDDAISVINSASASDSDSEPDAHNPVEAKLDCVEPVEDADPTLAADARAVLALGQREPDDAPGRAVFAGESRRRN